MARDQGLDDQIDSDEELLNFDLDDLSLLEDSGEGGEPEEEMIELVDLVERGPSEDITRDLKIREWSSAEGKKPGKKKMEGPSEEAEEMALEEEADLDLSDISLEMDAQPAGDKVERMFSGDEITEEDLEGLLQEEEGITLDLREESLEIQEKRGEEISEVDLQSLLSETGEQDLEEQDLEEQDLEEEESGEETPLEIMADEEVQEMDMERLEETQVLDFKSVVEETLVAEEPADILAKEVEELGAAAALVEDETAPVEAEVSEREGEEEEADAEVLLGLAEEPGQEEAEEEKFTEEEPFPEEVLTGLSEERIEEIIRNVVGEVVERVARETMTEVAERMIGEAIEALKQNLESSEF